ncbi:hypothetical protein E3E38_01810 [Thermococcus sp. 18S1]|uniref:hypothetical protein n=1 Tax=Thermococcus sp. 18S1 TaxID=1638210 RepID=UPI00143B926B|nr:hypothetical protein [Thermococcus sp. 18S1]NJE29792.1 hypothetical protein [Thermococcus sp. 18S1]
MQANVNLDALLEKMKAELERVKNPKIRDDFKKTEECFRLAEPFIRERERERKESALSKLTQKRFDHELELSTSALLLLFVMTPLAVMLLIMAITAEETTARILSLSGAGVFIVIGLGMYFSEKHKIAQITKEIEDIEKQIKDIDKKLRNAFSDNKHDCSNIPEILSGRGLVGYVFPDLESALIFTMEGKFEEARDWFIKSKEESEELAKKFESFPWKAYEVFGLKKREFIQSSKGIVQVLSFAARACDALYLGDVEKMRELLDEARRMLDERNKFVIGDIKFFKYLFEFHYFLLKAVVEAYEAEMGAVARATEEQAERFAAAKPVEVPETVERVTVSAEEPEKELYRGEVRFKMGAMSQERVGTLVITNKRLKLTGKYRLRGSTLALKAALRAAGIGEVYEDIPLKDIGWLELKKALLGGYYLEFNVRGKKYTIYTDAAQHIYNLLRQYTNT